MKKLYYVRHGQSGVNTDDTFSTARDNLELKKLTRKGIKQAENGAATAIERGLKFDLIICSPYLRTKQTAAIIAKKCSYPVEKIVYSELFIELGYGTLGGKSWSKYWKSGKTYQNLGEYEGAETIEQLQLRAQKALDYVKSLPNDNVLIVSHSAFGRALKRAVDNQPYTLEFTMPKEGKSLPFGEILEYV